jgi:hypothetical protein
MDIKLDDKRVRQIVYQLEDGTEVAYNFANGELLSVQTVSDESKETPTDRELINRAEKLNIARFKNRIKNMMSDSEMIEKIRNSEFMDELEDARKRFKISKAIADTFPDKDDNGNIKRPNMKYSDESLEIAKEIIKMDKEGKLDEILKRHGTKTIGDIIKRLEEPLVDSELSEDSSACQRNMRTIEEKILSRLRMDGDDTTNDDELKELVENYRFYKSKKREIDDKLWSTIPKVEPADCKGSHPVKKIEITNYGDR